MNTLDKELNVISSLMNEEFKREHENLEIIYSKLNHLINDEIPEILDKSLYLKNSSIMNKLIEKIDDIKILTVLPEIYDKNMVIIKGEGDYISDIFSHIEENIGSLIKMNSNLPLLLVNKEVESNKIYAITYFDKKIELDVNDYEILTKELYKNNIEISKLIKFFVVETNTHFENNCFLILPRYALMNHNLKGIVFNSKSEIFIAIKNEFNYSKSISEMKHFKLFFIIENEEKVIKEFKLSDDDKIISISDFLNLIGNLNQSRVRKNIKVIFDQILVEVMNYHLNLKLELKTKIERLTEVSFKLSNESLKEKVMGYKAKLNEELDLIQTSIFELEKFDRELDKACLEWDKTIYDSFSKKDLPLLFSTDDINKLLDLFFYYTESERFDLAKEILSKLSLSNYKDEKILSLYLKNCQGQIITINEEKIVKSSDDSNWVNVKIKIDLSEVLEYTEDELKQYVLLLPEIKTGKEFYYMAKYNMDLKKYKDASKLYFKSLEKNYLAAGKELLFLANNYPECKINIDELAENLIPEANYFVGTNNLKTKFKKAVVNLKMAASKKHLESIIFIADYLFKQCKVISWQDMKLESNQMKVISTIELYNYLFSIQKEEKYIMNVGLLYCKLQDYQRAYNILKNINKPEAQYECAKMYQYGNGVAKNIEKALEYYSKISIEYRDTKEQISKVKDQISKEKIRKEKDLYNSSKSYTSETYSSYEGSSFCFITTAACLALDKDRDCNELNLLRRFRDEHILGDEEGELLVKEYYRIGPDLVNHIDSDWNPFLIYKELWEDYILPTYDYIERKMWEKSKMTYILMVKKLCEIYQIKVEEGIMKKYDIKA